MRRHCKHTGIAGLVPRPGHRQNFNGRDEQHLSHGVTRLALAMGVVRDEPDGEIRVAGLDGVGKCGPDVVGFQTDLPCPHELIWAVRLFGCMRREIGVKPGMLDPQCAGLATVSKPVFTVLADGLEYPISGTEATVLRDDQRAGHQAGDQIDDGVLLDGLATTDFLDGVQGAAAREHRHAGKQPLFGVAE